MAWEGGLEGLEGMTPVDAGGAEGDREWGMRRRKEDRGALEGWGKGAPGGIYLVFFTGRFFFF